MIIKNPSIVKHLRCPTEAQALEICIGFTLALSKIYPKHMWRASIQQDVLYIQAVDLDSINAYSINLAEVDAEGKVLMRIGGEILERFNLSRGTAIEHEYAALNRDLMGEVIA